MSMEKDDAQIEKDSRTDLRTDLLKFFNTILNDARDSLSDLNSYRFQKRLHDITKLGGIGEESEQIKIDRLNSNIFAAVHSIKTMLEMDVKSGFSTMTTYYMFNSLSSFIRANQIKLNSIALSACTSLRVLAEEWKNGHSDSFVNKAIDEFFMVIK